MTGPPKAIDDAEHRLLAIEVWKKVVQTQEHFNEICMKVRTLYATVIAVILSVYGAFLKEGGAPVHVNAVTVDPIVPISLALVLVTGLFYFVDRFWYHQLLLGSVAQGAFIEERWSKIIPELRMGAEITAKSAIDISHRPLVAWFARFFVTDKRLKTNKRLHSDAKIEVFYKPPLVLALLVFFVAVLAGGIRVNGAAIGPLFWGAATGRLASPSTPEQQIRAQRAIFNKAITNGDIAAISRVLADNAQLITGSDSAVVAGKNAQLELWLSEFRDPGRVIYVRTPEQIVYSPFTEVAMETGEWRGADNRSQSNWAGGSYSAKWRKFANTWKIESEIFVTTGCGGRLCPAKR